MDEPRIRPEISLREEEVEIVRELRGTPHAGYDASPTSVVAARKLLERENKHDFL